MSKKQHDRQLARARAKRRTSKMDRRTSRNRVIIILMAALLVLSLFGSALIGILSGGGDGNAAGEPDPAAAETAEADAGTEGPCGPTPEDVPDVDSAVYDEPFEPTIDPEATYVATIDTTCGEIVVELDAANAPVTTNNFVNLADDGYYDGVVFHRVIPQFVAQAGDPAGGVPGSGFPGYAIADELDLAEELYAEVEADLLAELETAAGDEGLPEGTQVPAGYPRGTLAMANAGPDTNGSQFFITQGDPTLLPGPLYSVFGQVVEGLDVLDRIVQSPTDDSDRPLEDVVIRSVTIDVG